MKKRYATLLALYCLLSITVFSQVSLTTPNGTYSENFDVMGSTTVYPTGWTAIRAAGTGTLNATLTPAVSNGSSNSGAVYNVGTTSATDRALGSLSSGSTVPAFGASFTNNTGTAITGLSLSGFHEQWRTGSNALVESVVFEYSLDATSLSTGTWTAVPSLNLVEILTANSLNTAVDGNASGNRVAISGNITSISIPNGGSIWIRWKDNDDTGSDGLYAVDDLQIAYSNVAPGNTVSVAAGSNASETGTTGSFAISFSAPTTAPTDINFDFTGTAGFGVDYTASFSTGTVSGTGSSGTLTVPAGTSSVTVTLTPVDDASVEGTESISLALSAPGGGYSIGTGSASISLVDNDVAPTVSVAAGTNAAEPATNGSFNLTLSVPAPAGGITVTYTLGGTASIGTDYTDPQSGSINIAAGSTTATIILNVVDDGIFESPKTISISLTGATGGYVITNANASISLSDNDINPIALVTSYNQDFNTLANSGTSSTLPSGWAFTETGTAANLTYTAGTGSATAGDTYSFGPSGNTDRAFGGQLSGSLIPTIGASFINNSGTTITTLKITYTGEQWRFGATGRSDRLDFQYSLNAATLSSGTWTDVDALDFTAPQQTAAGLVDGNASANRVLVSYKITGLSIPSGAGFFIRWNDFNASGADDGLGVDDFTIEANPVDLDPPVIVSLSPANNATNVSLNQSATISFDEAIQKGTGNILIKKSSDGSIFRTIDITSASVTVSGSSVSFPLSALTANTGYYVEVQNGAIEDLSGNDFGISGSSTWSFTTGTVFFVADFQNCSSSISDGFTQFSQSGTVTWACTTFGRDPAAPAGTTAFPYGVQINGFSGGTNVPNVDWLISPSFDLTATTYPLLSFWSRTAFNGLPLQLKVSTDYTGGDPAAATWTDINGKFPAQTSNVWTLSSDINLAAFKGANVHLAFVYTSTDDDGARWTLDDMKLDDSPTPPPPSITTGTTDVQYTFVASGSSADKTFSFTGNDIISDVTLTASADFLLSKDGSTFSSSINYTQAEANNIPQTVTVRFSPTQENQNYAGTVTITTSGLSAEINLKGTSIDPANTLEVVNWNVEWFGSTVNGPTNDNQQEQNIKTILQNIGADVFGLVEVVDESRLANVVSQMPGYTYIVGQYGSHVNPPDPNGGSLSEAQKLAFVYKTSVLSNVVTRPLINNQDVSSTSYNNWSSGRYPFLMTADVTLHGVTKRINFVLIHAKANTSPTNISYQRRLASANELHDTLQTYFANDNVIVLGDFNDDLDQSITAGFTTTSYTAFTTDNAHFFSPTLALSLAHKKSTVSYNEMIDHVMLSNELQPYYMPATANVLTDVTALVSNYGSTTTDHYPVFTRYMYCELVCPSNVTVNTDPGTCGAVVNFTVGTTMNCGTVTATPASGSLFSAGTTTVTVVASSGETCSFTVTVNDQELPLITAPSNISVTADAGQCSAQISSLGTPETSDNCGVQSVTNDAPAGNQFTVGTHTLTWMVTDIHGNTTTAAQTITVTDTEAPLITAPAAITVSAQAGICAATISNLGNPATSDNCGIASTINDAPQNGVYAVGSHTITWTVTDVHGLTATATQTVTVTDNELPVIQTCPVVPVQCYNASGTYTVPEIEAHDNCGTVSYSFVVTGATSRSGTGTNASGTFAVGTSTITWTVRDDAGNTATCQTTVRINSPVSSSIPDVFAVSPGGAANTIYNGYGPASVTLTANVTGGTTPYAYKWTIGSSAGPALNSTASYTVSPVTTTTYFLNVKDVYGCSAPLVTRTINVVDVRCGPKQDKVVICQIVKGKPTTSCVLSKDVSSYLADGATLGTCPNANATQPMAGTPAQLRLTAMGMPNPSAHFFTIMLYGGITDEAVNVRVTDAVGRVTEQKNNLSSSRQFTLGMDYKPGMYFVEISQGTERIVLKLLKVK